MRGKLIFSFTLLLALSVSLIAAPIALTNPNFDADVNVSGFTLGALTGWSPNTTEYGTWNTTSPFIAPMSSGNVLFLSVVPGVTGGQLLGSVSQDSGAAVVPGGLYTFSIYVAKRGDIINAADYQLQLYSGSGPAFAVSNGSASALSSTGWTQYTVSGAASLSATGNIGVRVTLMPGTLPGGGDSVNKLQTLFDNAALDGPGTSDMPEPMTLSLIGSGLAGLALLRRRKK